jgi:LysM repeat protein
MMIVDQLVVQHQTLRHKTAEDPESVAMQEIMALLDQVQAASAHVENPQQREQLQAILYHWNGYVHTKTGAYPGTQLAPFSPLAAPAEPLERTAHVTTIHPDIPLPRVHWLVWALAILLFVGGGMMAVWPLIVGDGKTAAATPTPPAEAVFTAVAATQTAIAQEAAATRAAIEQTAAAAALQFVTATSSSQTLAATAATGPVTYVVQAGDTLFAIASHYGLTPTEIMTLNGLTTESLMVGQTLTLPHPPLTPQANSSTTPAPVTPQPTTPLPAGQQLVELVVRATNTSLYSGPGAEFSMIVPLPRGTFVYAVGRSQAGDWYLVQLEDGVTRGWLSAADGGLLYPAVPETIPVIVVP